MACHETLRKVAERYKLKTDKGQKPGRNPGWTSVTPCDRAVRGTLKLGSAADTATVVPAAGECRAESA